jgi:transcriptional regulator with XRE-family HTH domain
VPGTAFGKLLRQLRGEADLKQEELAERAHISVQALRNIESGETAVPHAKTISSLVNALRLTDDDARELREALEPAGTSDPDPRSWLDEAAEILAGEVRRQWEAEAVIRHLRDPLPLDVRWSPAAAELGDNEEVIRDVARRGGGRTRQLSLHGGADQVVEAFRGLPQPRLVVLGPPGSGKTGLLVLLTVGLLRDRRPGPVPVLLSLSAWDAAREGFHAWVRRRLREDHPRLRSLGSDAAGDLVRQGRVLPLLDGLDELPQRLRSRAIDELARLGPEHPLVIACRSREYEQVVAAGSLVRAAPVVELDDLAPAAVIAYLRAGRSFLGAPARWEPVLAHLGRGEPGPLVGALSTPLMASLARTVYDDSGADPGELVDERRFSCREAIEDHLLDALIPAVFADDPPADDPRRRWRADEARRWLTYLAERLQQRGTRDLAWWDLSPWRPSATPLLCLAGTALFGVAGWWLGTGYALLMMAVGGCGFGFMIGFTDDRWPVRTASRLDRQLGASLLGGLGSGLGLGLKVGLGVGAVFGALAVLISGSWVWLLAVLLLAAALALPVCLAWGLGSALVGALVRTSGDLVSPRAALRSDRTALAFTLATAGLGIGVVELVLGLVPVVAEWMLWGLRLGARHPVNVAGPLLSLLHPFALVGLATIVAVYPWPKYQAARAWYAMTGRLPRRLMGFLDDAHHLGVLRQVGPVYQFRHARLQERLAGDVPPIERRWPSDRMRSRARSAIGWLRVRNRRSGVA